MKTLLTTVLASLIFAQLLMPLQALAETTETRTIPKFRILRVYDNAVALFMMARVNQLTIDSWEQFHDKSESTYKNIFDGSSQINFDSAIKLQKMHMAAVYMSTYYTDLRRVTVRMISKAYRQSPDTLAFAQKLEELTEKTSVSCESLQDEKIQARIQTAMKFMIALRPLRAENVQAEYQQYLEMVSSVCN